MKLTDAPVKLTLPFSNAGARRDIPVASQIGITAGRASYVTGFPPSTMTPLASGGSPPSGLDFNGLLYTLSAIIRWNNSGAGFVWDSEYANDANVVGYPAGARVLRSDGAGYWLNLTDDNTSDPEGAGAAVAGWVPDFTAGVASITMTGSSVTLSILEYGKPIIAITGTLTANLNLIFPNIGRNWTVINSTTGAYVISGKTSGGTGVTIPSGAGILVCDGNDVCSYIRNSSNALLAENNLNDLENTTTALNNLGISQPPEGITHQLTVRWLTNTTITIFANGLTVRSPSTGKTVKFTAATLTLNSATSGANGRDAGSLAANTLYYIYAIYNAGTATYAALMSTSATSPVLPSGFTYVSLVSVAYTDGSLNFKGFVQNGNSWQYRVGSNLSALPIIGTGATGSTTTPTFTSIAYGTYIPPNAGKGVFVIHSDGNVLFGANGSYGNAASLTNPAPFYHTGVANHVVPLVLETSNVYWASDGGNGANNRVAVLGFELNL